MAFNVGHPCIRKSCGVCNVHPSAMLSGARLATPLPPAEVDWYTDVQLARVRLESFPGTTPRLGVSTAHHKHCSDGSKLRGWGSGSGSNESMGTLQMGHDLFTLSHLSTHRVWK